MLKTLYVIMSCIKRIRLLRDLRALSALVAMSWVLACGSVGKLQQELLIREEVEKGSSFQTKWNELKMAKTDGTTELWAADFVQGNSRTRMLWIVWKGKEKVELYPFPSQGDLLVEACFNRPRQEILAEALSLANRYVDLQHKWNFPVTYGTTSEGSF